MAGLLSSHGSWPDARYTRAAAQNLLHDPMVRHTRPMGQGTGAFWVVTQELAGGRGVTCSRARPCWSGSRA